MPNVDRGRIAHLGPSALDEGKLEIPLGKGNRGRSAKKPVVLDMVVGIFLSLGEQPIPQIRRQERFKHLMT